MRVGELKEILEDFDDDDAVRIGIQPNHPIDCRIADVVEGVYEDCTVIYILQGSDVGYMEENLW